MSSVSTLAGISIAFKPNLLAVLLVCLRLSAVFSVAVDLTLTSLSSSAISSAIANLDIAAKMAAVINRLFLIIIFILPDADSN